jgi:hypothetical protein
MTRLLEAQIRRMVGEYDGADDADKPTARERLVNELLLQVTNLVYASMSPGLTERLADMIEP